MTAIDPIIEDGTKMGDYLPSGFYLIEKFDVPDLDWERAILLGENPLKTFADEKFGESLIKNSYVNAGGVAILNLIAGAGGTAFNNANAYIGVGDSSTAVAASQTDLQAATNKLRKAMSATFPSLSGQVMSWQSAFGNSEANYAWAEVALFNNSSAGTMLSRIVQALGTKASGTWTVTYTITIP